MTNRLLHQWEANAQAYAALINGRGTPHHREILNPCINQLLDNVKGLRVLDAGCGEGYIARELARTGATVIGVDLSSALIKMCQQHSEKLDTEFIQGDIRDLHFLDANSFDLVLCNLVLLNIDHFEKALQEFFRVLKPTGVLVFSVVHPAFNIYGPGQWKLGPKDSRTGRRKGEYFIVDHYVDEKEYLIRWKNRDGEGFPEEFSFFHRTLQTYLSTVIESGFTLVAVKEPLPRSNDPFFERERRIPFFLVVKAKKTE